MIQQIKERCIYCGSDVYYSGCNILIKCGLCGHTLTVSKFENELARMQQAIEEGEQAKRELDDAKKAQREAETRLFETVETLDDLGKGQAVLSKLIESVISGQGSAADKLEQVQELAARILKSQGDIFGGMSILGEMKEQLRTIGMSEQESKAFARDFVDWVQNIHAEDAEVLENITSKADKALQAQKEIGHKVDSLQSAADRTQAAIDAFRERYEKDKLEELQRLYRQAQDEQFDRDFDKAMDRYKQILKKGGDDATVLWHMILCHYCVYYQEDADGAMVPIILNPDLTDPDEMSLRLNFENVLSDETLVSRDQAQIYRDELAKIDDILDRYRHVRHANAYDIFISTRQEDGGRYTKDSDVAAELYHYLVSRGYRVFNSRFARIPAGEEYEPYIIAALLSARVMIVVGTNAGNMTTDWVKNEWSRFQWLRRREEMQRGHTDRILLCYLAGDMRPAEVPRGLDPSRQAIVDGINSADLLLQALEGAPNRQPAKPKTLVEPKTSAEPARPAEPVKPEVPVKPEKPEVPTPPVIPPEPKVPEEPKTPAGSGKRIVPFAVAAVLVIAVLFAGSRIMAERSRRAAEAEAARIAESQAIAEAARIDREEAAAESLAAAEAAAEESRLAEEEAAAETETASYREYIRAYFGGSEMSMNMDLVPGSWAGYSGKSHTSAVETRCSIKTAIQLADSRSYTIMIEDTSQLDNYEMGYLVFVDSTESKAIIDPGWKPFSAYHGINLEDHLFSVSGGEAYLVFNIRKADESEITDKEIEKLEDILRDNLILWTF